MVDPDEIEQLRRIAKLAPTEEQPLKPDESKGFLERLHDAIWDDTKKDSNNNSHNETKDKNAGNDASSTDEDIEKKRQNG